MIYKDIENLEDFLDLPKAEALVRFQVELIIIIASNYPLSQETLIKTPLKQEQKRANSRYTNENKI